MSFLLDTNVLSEAMRPKSDPRVSNWFANTSEVEIFISVLSIGEVRRGIEKLDPSPRRDKLEGWIDRDVISGREHRLLPISLAVAERWGRLLAEVGRSLPVVYSLIAATALHHDLKLVTRNRRDFAIPGLIVVNPWD